MTDFSSEILPTRKIWSDFEELRGGILKSCNFIMDMKMVYNCKQCKDLQTKFERINCLPACTVRNGKGG